MSLLFENDKDDDDGGNGAIIVVMLLPCECVWERLLTSHRSSPRHFSMAGGL